MAAGSLLNRNVTIAGRRTSMKLEPDMWDALDEICRREQITMHEACTMVADRHRGNNLTAAMRVFILGYYRAAATEQGHVSAGHGRPRRRLAAVAAD
ncbi:MAG TPA: ribbon-helix-helix domain-containing protein [Candidatus Sulfotelmatobacter sp.]|jgi:predicted DNA-binding ribbon-helix-helix protein|nr:ribbon-helix-helix domain-containing protein [Candidatus Sulfotelmatobacter sp.]